MVLIYCRFMNLPCGICAKYVDHTFLFIICHNGSRVSILYKKEMFFLKLLNYLFNIPPSTINIA